MASMKYVVSFVGGGNKQETRTATFNGSKKRVINILKSLLLSKLVVGNYDSYKSVDIFFGKNKETAWTKTDGWILPNSVLTGTAKSKSKEKTICKNTL